MTASIAIAEIQYDGPEAVRKVTISLFMNKICYQDLSGCRDFFAEVKVTYQDGDLVSARFDYLYECDGMPRPVSFDGGLVFRKTSGELVSLHELIGIDDVGIVKKIVLENAKKLVAGENCPDPHYSGEFFIRGDGQLVFVEFFPSHVMSPCEIEVALPRSAFSDSLPPPQPAPTAEGPTSAVTTPAAQQARSNPAPTSRRLLGWLSGGVVAVLLGFALAYGVRKLRATR